MRLLRAIGDFFSDLANGDPVALIIAGCVLLLLLVPLTFWIIDLRRRKKEKAAREARAKGKPKGTRKPNG
jgi:hypothetical protein